MTLWGALFIIGSIAVLPMCIILGSIWWGSR
jgi:hypothetical protein